MGNRRHSDCERSSQHHESGTCSQRSDNRLSGESNMDKRQPGERDSGCDGSTEKFTCPPYNRHGDNYCGVEQFLRLSCKSHCGHNDAGNFPTRHPQRLSSHCKRTLDRTVDAPDSYTAYCSYRDDIGKYLPGHSPRHN